MSKKVTACAKEVTGEKEPPCSLTIDAEDKPLDSELQLLRDALGKAHGALSGGDEDMAKLGTLVARLTDSIGRALLTQQKLMLGSANPSTQETDFDNMLRAMGLGEI